MNLKYRVQVVDGGVSYGEAWFSESTPGKAAAVQLRQVKHEKGVNGIARVFCNRTGAFLGNFKLKANGWQAQKV